MKQLLLIPIFLLTALSSLAEEIDTDLKKPECNGETIRKITIQLEDVFQDPELEWFYRSVNDLKINTKTSVIDRELLFSEGDSCDSFRLQETERVLRELRYLRRVKVTPIKDGSFVDIHIQAQDTWTLLPQINFSSGTGRNSREFGIVESNIAGYGKRGEFLYKEEENRQTFEAVYQDPRVWNSDLQLLLALFDRNDGQRGQFQFGKPFRSLYDKDSWSTKANSGDTVGRLFANGDERFIFQQDKLDLEAKYTFSSGEAKEKVSRYTFGYRYEDSQFEAPTREDYKNLDIPVEQAPFDPKLLAADRKFSGPLVSYSYVEPEFISRNYIDRFDREQDFNLGPDFSITAHLASDALGSYGDHLITSINRASGYELSPKSFYLGEVGASTRFGSSQFENTLLRGEVKFFYVMGPLSMYELSLGRHTFATGLSIDYGIKLDRDREFLLGADTGLRGYEAKTFYGDKRLVYNAEQRVHIADDLLKLVSVGAAAFFDAGASTTGNGWDLVGDRLFADVGVGLRFAFPRSSGGRVLRVDLAFPLREYEDDNRFELRLIFGGGQIFSSHPRSESLGDEAANVSVGFDQ